MRRTDLPRRGGFRAAAAAASLAALATPGACGGDATPERVPISIRLSLLAAETCFVCSSPDDCPLDCGGTIGIWAVDADTDEVLDSDCLAWDYTPGQTLRSLSALLQTMKLENGLVEGRRVVVEVASFYPPTMEGCSRVHVTADGDLPHTDAFEYPLYFGRSDATTLGEAPAVVDTPLECVSNLFGCATPPDVISMDATVIDIDRQGPPESPEMLDVHSGHLFYDFSQDDVLAHATFSFDVGLQWQAGVWHRDLEELLFFDPSCVGSIVSRLGPAFTAPTASCEGYQDETGYVYAQAYFVDKLDMNRILDALSLSEFPAAGLLVGRVVDPFTGLPSAGAVVAPDAPDTTATILYLEDAADGKLAVKPSGPTSTNGYFVVTELAIPGTEVPSMGDPARLATCCAYFAATGSDGQTGYSNALVGLIDGVAMGTTINLSGPGSGVGGSEALSRPSHPR